MTQRIERMRTRKARHEGGFTLIELLVVIIVLGVIAAVVVFAVRGSGDKGKAAALSADAKTMRTAQEAYCAKNGEYAPNQAALVGDKFLSEGSTLHDTKRVTPGPCGNTALLITCNPTEPTCGADGTTPDGSLVGPTGAWTKAGDLPVGSQGSALITMSNGKVLSWGTKPGAPPTCPAPGDASCYGNVATQTYGTWAPGPIAIYDPATATWAAAPDLPGRPAWDPLTAGVMTNITGTPAECGTSCGKVFIQVSVGGVGSARLVPPDYRNQDFFLFDPATLTWTTVNPPAGLITGHGTQVMQMACGSRPTGSDCGKVMVFGYGIDDNGQYIPPVRDYDAPQFQVALFDPTDGTWGTTSSPIRRIANDGAFDPAYGTNQGTGVVPYSSFDITDAAGGFRTTDVGKAIYARTYTGSGGWLGSGSVITGVSGCTGASCTTATLNKMSVNAHVSTVTDTKTDQIFFIGSTPSSMNVLGASPGKPAGRVVIAGGNSSAVYNPVTRAWTETTQTNLTSAVPQRDVLSATLSTTSSTTNFSAIKRTVNLPNPPTTPFYGSDVGSLVTGTNIAPGTRIAKVNNTRQAVLTQIPTNGTTPSIVTLAIGPSSPDLGQIPTYTCSGSPEPVPPSWQATGNLALTDGRVLALGKDARCAPATPSSNSLLFTPTTDTWAASPTLCSCYAANSPGVVLLGVNAGSKPLMVYAADQQAVGAYPASALGAADGTAWTTVASTFTRRALNSDGTPRTGTPTAGMALLPNGQVLLAGGTKCSNTGCTAVVGQTDTWLYTPPIP
ncbi:MAG: prepilin-type N-terminal cleavage/methylation domain-containing protein [Acidimicrobiales bacterium]